MNQSTCENLRLPPPIDTHHISNSQRGISEEKCENVYRNDPLTGDYGYFS